MEEVIKLLAKENTGISKGSVKKDVPLVIKEGLLSLFGKQKVEDLKGFDLLDADIQHNIKQTILYWSLRRASWNPSKQVYEAAEAADTLKEFTQMCFPNEDNGDKYGEYIDYMVSKKYQLVLNQSDVSKTEKLLKIMEKYPRIIEVIDGNKLFAYNLATKSLEEIAGVPKSKHPVKGKVSGQADGFPFIRILYPIYTDTNSGFRFEELARLPYSLTVVNEFVSQKEPSLTTEFLSFGEKIFHKQLTVEGKASNLSDETWTLIVQRFLSRSDPRGGVSFYGHPGGTHRVIMKNINAQPPDRPSEDIVFGWRMWQNGFRTRLVQHIIFDKQRPPSFLEDTTPKTKFAAGAGDLAISIMKYMMENRLLSVPQKYIQVFSLSFYFRKPLVGLFQFLYVGSIVMMGYGIYVGFPYYICFGLFGFIISQSITVQQWLLLVENNGILKGSFYYVMMMPLNFIYFVGIIFMYIVGVIVGLLSKAGFKSTGKALPIVWAKVKDILAFSKEEYYWAGVGSIMILAALLPWIGSGLSVFLWMAGALIIAYPVYREVRYQQEVNFVKCGILLSIALASWAISGLILWQTFSVVWSITYILLPVIAILTPLLRQPPLIMKIYNHKENRIKFWFVEMLLLAASIWFMNGVFNYLGLEIAAFYIAGIPLNFNMIGGIIGAIIFFAVSWQYSFLEYRKPAGIGKKTALIAGEGIFLITAIALCAFLSGCILPVSVLNLPAAITGTLLFLWINWEVLFKEYLQIKENYSMQEYHKKVIVELRALAANLNTGDTKDTVWKEASIGVQKVSIREFRDEAKAKEGLYSEVIRLQFPEKIEKFLAVPANVKVLREAIEKKDPGIVLNAFWKGKFLGELKEAGRRQRRKRRCSINWWKRISGTRKNL